MRINKKKDNKTELRQRIMKAATDAFCERGIKQVTMDEIASSLSVSKRTIYKIFRDKEELLLEIVKVHEEETAKYIEDKCKESENVLDVFFAIFKRVSNEIEITNPIFFKEINKYPLVVDFLKRRKEETADRAINGFKDGVKEGLFRSDVNIDIIRVLIIEEMNLILKSGLLENYPILQLHETMFFMHLRGIATDKGLKIIEQFQKNMDKMD